MKFERQIDTAAKRHNVKIESRERVSGFWQGEQEPSFALEVRDGETGVRNFSEEMRSAWDQDGVLTFRYDSEGDAVLYRLDGAEPAAIAKALTELGIEAATVRDGGVEIIGDVTMVGKIAELRARLKIPVEKTPTTRGRFAIVERPEGGDRMSKNIDAELKAHGFQPKPKKGALLVFGGPKLAAAAKKLKK